MFRRAVTALSLCALTAATACSDSSSPVSPTDEAVPVRAMVIGGDNQLIPVMQEGLDTLAVRFFVPSGAPVAGATVTWTLNGDGRVTAVSALTDAAGVARAVFQAGAKAGTATVTAALGSDDVEFVVRVSAADPSRLQAMAMTTDTLSAGKPFNGAPVRVLDQYGNPVADVPLTATIFAAESDEPEAQLSLVANADGIARLGTELALPAGTHRLVYAFAEHTVTYQLVVMPPQD
ncbi:MAG: Ig-like domain-containing protein [Gemmatimonas sp.]|jgi:hypothetical protein|uniref:Ig-like domain-containing protein n=1 Tax=Gemmatimonas sp. TaxID=1962908 RepID=UPI0039199860